MRDSWESLTERLFLTGSLLCSSWTKCMLECLFCIFSSSIYCSASTSACYISSCIFYSSLIISISFCLSISYYIASWLYLILILASSWSLSIFLKFSSILACIYACCSLSKLNCYSLLILRLGSSLKVSGTSSGSMPLRLPLMFGFRPCCSYTILLLKVVLQWHSGDKSIVLDSLISSKFSWMNLRVLMIEGLF